VWVMSSSRSLKPTSRRPSGAKASQGKNLSPKLIELSQANQSQLVPLFAVLRLLISATVPLLPGNRASVIPVTTSAHRTMKAWPPLSLGLGSPPSEGKLLQRNAEPPLFSKQ